MSDKKRYKLTLDSSTTASNPGKVSFKLIVWLRHRPLPMTVLAVLLAASLVLAVGYYAEGGSATSDAADAGRSGGAAER